MYAMFSYFESSEIDLSIFDMTYASDVRDLFLNSEVQLAQAQTEEDIVKFNKSTSKHNGLTFKAK